MICWDRVDGQIIGTFTPRQIRWIRKHVGVLHATVNDVIFPVGAPMPAWPTGTGDGGFDVVRHTLADAAVVLGTLPATGGVVVLSGSHQIWAWIWTLSECRTYLAVRLGLVRRPAQTATPPRWGVDGRIERSLSTVTNWLESVVDDLIGIADLNYPTVDF